MLPLSHGCQPNYFKTVLKIDLGVKLGPTRLRGLQHLRRVTVVRETRFGKLTLKLEEKIGQTKL